MVTHNLFSNYQIYIFDLKRTHNKTCYINIIIYFLHIYLHVNVHTYHVHELIYHSLSGLYFMFGQNKYAINSPNTPYS